MAAELMEVIRAANAQREAHLVVAADLLSGDEALPSPAHIEAATRQLRGR